VIAKDKEERSYASSNQNPVRAEGHSMLSIARVLMGSRRSRN
jgi:hypothetical protein